MKALICGVNGQDGAFLAELLLKKDYKVFGTSRDSQGSSFGNLTRLKIKPHIELLSMVPEDFRSVLVTIRHCNPDEIYFLSGQSSVGLSFEQPAETIQSFVIGLLNLLEAAKMVAPEARIYNAGSSEIFGDTEKPADETAPFLPKSPYAVAKASCFWLANSYRQAYHQFVCTGILFNHESFLRPQRYVTQKIISAAKLIANGSKEKLQLGRLDIIRDWGWAPEYVEAMWLMLQNKVPQDFVIATGESFRLEDFVRCAFEELNLNWKEHVEICSSLGRPNDLLISRASPNRAKDILGWQAKSKMPEVVKQMLKS